MAYRIASFLVTFCNLDVHSPVFWATACKTVCHVLSVRCMSVLSVCLSVYPVCLSVTLLCCSHTAGWIKVKLGTKVGLGLYIVLNGNPAPPHSQRGTALNFQPMSVVAKRLVGARCHLVRR